MDRTLQGATAIVGIGQTEFSKAAGRSETQLAAEATMAALADAGLGVADVDGLVSYTIDPVEETELVRTLGIPEVNSPAECLTVEAARKGCSSTRRQRWRQALLTWSSPIVPSRHGRESALAGRP